MKYGNKRIGITIGLLASVCALSTWLPNRYEEKNKEKSINKTHSEHPAQVSNNKLQTEAVTKTSAPKKKTKKAKSDLNVDMTDEILASIPTTLNPRTVIGYDVITENGKPLRRSIVTTDSGLGKILVVEKMDNNNTQEQFIFSAEHVLISLKEDMSLENEFLSSLKETLSLEKPFSNCKLLFANVDVNRPSELYGSYGKVKELLGDHAIVELDAVGEIGAVPNDDKYYLQYQHQNVRSELAWDLTTGSEDIIVAVIDTGISDKMFTPELDGRVISGYDFVNNDAIPTDDVGHGTQVSAIIAANANNGVTIAGVDWNCKIMPIKGIDSDRHGLYSWFAAGIYYAIENGANVINLSAGGASSSSALTYAIDTAIENGLIFVTITHNDGRGNIRFPGNYTPSITVGATDIDDVMAPFSNWGPEIDLVAPGYRIYSSDEYGIASKFSGTSFSAPQVAGAAALMLSIDPTLNQQSMSELLDAGADDLVGDHRDTEGFDIYYGWGRLNIYNSLLLTHMNSTNENLLLNGDFSLRQGGWNYQDNLSEGYEADFNFTNGQCTVDIYQDGDLPWKIHMAQRTYSHLIEGESYILSYDVKSDTDRTIEPFIMLEDTPWTKAITGSNFIPGDNMVHTFSQTNTITEITDDYTLFLRLAGSGPGTIVIDNVSLAKVKDTLADELYFSSPTNNQTFKEGESIDAEVVATDSAGIDKVLFKLNGVWKATLTEAPFIYSYGALPRGTHELRVDKRNNDGNWTADIINIEVVQGATPPTADVVYFSSPTNGQIFEAGETILAEATVSDPSGIDKVLFKLNGVWKATLTEAPFIYSYGALPRGTHELRVDKRDNDGNWTADTITIEVIEGTTPPIADNITFISPTSGTTFSAGQDVPAEMDITDPAGVEKVIFKLDGAWKATYTQGPFNYVYKNLTAGTHELSVQKKSGSGVWSSESITITVQ